MRKLIALVCLLTLIVVPAAAKPKFFPNLSAGASDEIEIEIGKSNGKSNGKAFNMPNAPFISSGKTYMPVRSLAGLLGAKVDYKTHKNGDMITLTFPGNIVTIAVPTRRVEVDGEYKFTLKSPILVNKGTAFVPLAELAGALGYSSSFIPPGKVVLKKDKSVAPPAPDEVSFVRPSNKTLRFTINPNDPKVIIGKASDILANPGEHAGKQVLVVYRGKANSGGYGVEIKELSSDEKALIIDVNLTSPVSGYYYTTNINYPYDVVVLNSSTQFTTWSSPQLGKGDVAASPIANVNVNRLGQVSLKQRLNAEEYTVVVGKAKDLLQSLGQVNPETNVMVVYRGECNSGGYGIEVESATYVNGVATISVKLIDPIPGSFNTMALTYPYDVVVLPTSASFNTWFLTAGGSQLGFGTVTSLNTVSFVSLGTVELKVELSPANPLVIAGTAQSLLKASTLEADTPIVVVYRGVLPTTGYGVVPTRVTLTGGSLEIDVSLTGPSNTSVARLDYPYCVIALPKGTVMSGWVLRAGNELLGKDTLKKAVAFTEAPTGLDLTWIDRQQAGVSKKVMSVDGYHQLVVIVKYGQAPTSGHGLELNAAWDLGNGVIDLDVEYVEPSSDETVFHAVTYPYKAYVFDATLQSKTFELSEKINILKDWSVVTYPLNLSTVDRTVRGLHIGYGTDLLLSEGGEANTLFAVVKRGQCPTLGYGIAVTSIELQEGIVRINAKSIDPAPGSMVGQAITYPYQLIKLNPALVEMSFEMYLDGVKVLPQTSK